MIVNKLVTYFTNLLVSILLIYELQIHISLLGDNDHISHNLLYLFDFM